MAGIRATDGAIMLNGSPFFPIGLYHVSHYDAEDTRRLVDLAFMARAGFNTICTPLKLANADEFLKACAALGIWAIVENNDPNGILTMVSALKGRPGLLGWQVYDDLGRVGSKSPAEVKALHDQIKAIDPQALTYSSYGAVARELYKYVGSVDILALQTYPVPDESVSATSNSMDTATRACAASHRACIANCQAYGWPGKRAPRPEEVRMMTYRALAMRAKGMIWYTMYDPVWSLRASGLWPTMEALAQELNGMAAGLLAGTL